MAFSPEHNHIVSGSGDGSICIWDAETGGLISGLLKGRPDTDLSTAFSTDGRRIASGTDRSGMQRRAISLQGHLNE